jgi:DNA-binding transcriptional ArsR family regulator
MEAGVEAALATEEGALATELTAEDRGEIGLRIARALGHATRVRILELLSEDDRSPVEMAIAIAGDKSQLTNVNYHTKILWELGCVEKVGREPVRGTYKQMYRSKMSVLFEDFCWASLSQQVRSEISVTVFGNILRRTGDAMKASTFDAKKDRHMSLQTVPVDLVGWDEIRELMAGTMESVVAIAKGAKGRGENLVPATVALLSFESPRLYEKT